MITGAHTVVYARDAQAARRFFRDVLELPSVDVGEGWLIFGLPPSEVAAHPAEGADHGTHELFLMCDDVERTVAHLKKRGVEFIGSPTDQGYGIMTRLKIPGGGEIGLYEPRHARPPSVAAAKPAGARAAKRRPAASRKPAKRAAARRRKRARSR